MIPLQLLLVQHHYVEAGEVLNQTSGLMENYHGPKEMLIRTFYLVVQVSHLLVAGQIKAAKPHLKQLQQRVKVSDVKLFFDKGSHTLVTLCGSEELSSL